MYRPCELAMTEGPPGAAICHKEACPCSHFGVFLPPKKRELGTGTSHGSLRRSMKTDRPRRHWEPVKFCFQSRKITVSSHEEIQLMAPVDSFSREDTRKPETPLNMGMYLGLSSWWPSISISSLDSHYSHLYLFTTEG